MAINDGGPAFPSTGRKAIGMELVPTNIPGMTLRDYFAAKAIQGLLAAQFDGGAQITLAEHAFHLADTMLAERSKP